MPDIAEGFVYYVVFLFSTTLHEAAHAWAAKLGGDPTAYHGGQVSLDPIPHIRRSPFGMVALPVMSVLMTGWPFGFASAPFDPDWARQHPRKAAWMALAGPGANLLLVVLAALLVQGGIFTDLLRPPDSIRFGHITAATVAEGPVVAVAFALGTFFSLNLMLFVLNMLPIPPLDGSGALPLVLPKDLVPRYQEVIWGQPALGWIGILVAWQVFDEVFNPIFFLLTNLLYPGINYS